MEQALPLLDAVSLGGVELGRAVPLPVAGMSGAPFAGAIPADLAILRIGSELLAAALLAHSLRADHLFRWPREGSVESCGLTGSGPNCRTCVPRTGNSAKRSPDSTTDEPSYVKRKIRQNSA